MTIEYELEVIGGPYDGEAFVFFAKGEDRDDCLNQIAYVDINGYQLRVEELNPITLVGKAIWNDK